MVYLVVGSIVSPTILYALIASKDNCILAYLCVTCGADEEEKLPALCRKLLRMKTERNGRQTYVLGDRSISYHNLRQRFRAYENTPSMDMTQQAVMTKLLQESLIETEEAGHKKFEKLQRGLQGVTEIMEDNITQVIERGEHIDCLVDKTQELSEESGWLMESSRQLRKTTWRRKVRCYIFTTLAVVLLCGLFSYKNIPRGS